MTTLAEPDVLDLASPTPDRETFVEHFRYTNPFAANRVVPSAALKDDADQVHRGAFNRLTELARQALRQELAFGALVWGEAGIGKSHLLSRLANWAESEHRQAVFIYLTNLQAQPDQLPRSLLRCVVSILTRGLTTDFRATPLFRIVNATLRYALQADPDKYYTWGQAEAAYEQLTEDFCASAPAGPTLVDRAALTALFSFFRSAYLAYEQEDDGIAGLAVRWLAGETLELEEARRVGLPPPGPGATSVALADDEQIKQVLIALARFTALWERPFILCFDQADNLEREQFAALSRFLHALLDGATNLLVVTAGVRATIFRWESEGVFTHAARDRIAQYRIELQRIGPAQARQVLEARLRPFQAPFLDVESVGDRIRQDDLFPLGADWAEARFADKVEMRPRDVINWAAEEWRRQQEALGEALPSWLDAAAGDAVAGAAPPAPHEPPELTPDDVDRLIDDHIELKMREHVRQRQLDPHNLPPDGDNLAGLVCTLLRHCVNTPEFPALVELDRQVRPKYGPPPPFDMVLRKRPGAGPETRVGLLCLVASNRTAMSGYLRRLAQDAAPPDAVFLVTDDRCPLDPAAAGFAYLQSVRERQGEQFRQVNLTFDEYAELDALQAVVGLARSGDLEVELPGDDVCLTLLEADVIASHFRRGRFRKHALLRALLADPATPPAAEPAAAVAPSALLDNDADEASRREFIMSRVGLTMGCSSTELAVHYHEHLRQTTPLEPPDVSACRARLEETARRLHGEGLLNATPHDDYLYLLNR